MSQYSPLMWLATHSLIEAGEESTPERLEARRQQLVYSKVEEHNGRIVRATGGSLLVEFASPTEAVRCAVEVQRGMIDRNIGAAADRRIAFRIGINIGDVTPTGDDLVSRAVAALPTDRLMTLVKPGTEIYGNSSKIAERIAAFAQPGGICISGAVWDAIRDQLPSAFEDLGKQNLDIGAGPVHCFAMRPELRGSWTAHRGAGCRFRSRRRHVFSRPSYRFAKGPPHSRFSCHNCGLDWRRLGFPQFISPPAINTDSLCHG